MYKFCTVKNKNRTEGNRSEKNQRADTRVLPNCILYQLHDQSFGWLCKNGQQK